MQDIDPRIPRELSDMSRGEIVRRIKAMRRIQLQAMPTVDAVIAIGLVMGLDLDAMSPLPDQALVMFVRGRAAQAVALLENPSVREDPTDPTTFDVTDNKCWSCGSPILGQTPVAAGPVLPPSIGDIGICFTCTQIQIYDASPDGLVRRPPTEEERAEILQLPVATAAISSILDHHASGGRA